MKPDPYPMIRWDRPLLARFKRVVKANAGCDTFLFDGHEFVLGYAKHLIEFLDETLEKKRA